MKDKFVIFGASQKGKSALEIYRGGTCVAFIDNDPKKWGGYFYDVPIISLSEYKLNFKNVKIVIASQYEVEIIEQLLANMIYEFELYTSSKSDRENVNRLNEEFQEFNLQDNVAQQSNQLAVYIHNNSGSNAAALQKSGVLENLTCPVKWHHDSNKNKDYIKDLLTSKYAVITHNKILLKQTKAIQLWHGFPLKGLNLMSQVQTRQAREKARCQWDNYQAIASYSTMYTSLMNACYGVNVEKYIVTGMPRNDLLFEKGASKRLETLIGRALKDRRVVLYMPTFRKTKFGQVNGDENLTIFGIPDFNKEDFFLFLDRYQLVFLVKPHPYHEDDFGLGVEESLPECIWKITEEILADNGVDFYEILAATDILITDYSSVYFDYLLLNKPIIFTPSDAESYSNTRGFVVEPYDFWAPGPKCLDQVNLQLTILNELDTPQSYNKEREVIKRIVHHFDDNESTLRVAKVISDMTEN